MPPRKKPEIKEYQFINRDIIAGLILALTARPAPDDAELNNNPEEIALWRSLYNIREKLLNTGWSPEMPFQWLHQEYPKIIYPDLSNPNVYRPPVILDLYDALADAEENIKNIVINDEKIKGLI